MRLGRGPMQRAYSLRTHDRIADPIGPLPASGPKRAYAEEGSILHATRYSLPPPRSRIGAVGHTQYEPPFARMDRRYLVTDPRSFEHHGSVGRRAYCGLAPVYPCPQFGMAQAGGGSSHIGDGNQHREMPPAVEIMVVVPADVVARLVVEQHRQRTLV